MKDYMRMNVAELVKSKSITLTGEGRFGAWISKDADGEALLSAIRARKTEIIEYITAAKVAERIAREERQAKIDAIEGLDEILTAQAEWDQYRYEYNRRQDDEYESSILPSRPTSDIPALRAKYPRANAYLMAEAYWNAANDIKAAAGRKAVERIINGEDYNKVIAEMKAEWDAEVDRHMWD